MESVARASPEVWLRHSLDGLFSEEESTTRRRLYAEVGEIDSALSKVSEQEFASELLLAQLNLFVSVAANIHPHAENFVPALRREYLSRLPAAKRVAIEKADAPYTVRVRSYGEKGIWPYTAVAEVFIERLGCRPTPALTKRIELALALLGELWQMDALRYSFG